MPATRSFSGTPHPLSCDGFIILSAPGNMEMLNTNVNRLTNTVLAFQRDTKENVKDIQKQFSEEDLQELKELGLNIKFNF